MSNFQDFPTSTQPESNSYSQEEFEKVGPGDFDQQPAESERDDQVPTSTAYTGDEAEEDRYGTSESDAVQNLVNFGDDMVVDEPQSTTPSAPEVGDFAGLDHFSEMNREAEAASLNPFSDPVTTTTTAANDYSYGDEELFGDIPKPASDPITNLLTDSTESKEYDGNSEALPISGGAWMKNVDPRESGEVNPAFEDDSDQTPIIEELPEVSSSPTPSDAPIVSPSKGGQSFASLCPAVLLDLVYWRDVKKTAVVFGSMMFLLLSLAFFSVLSVVAYLALAALTITLSFRVYKNVLQAVQKTGDQHPFKQYLDMNLELPEDKVQRAVENVLRHVNNTSRELRRLFLVEDLIDSIKFGLFLWVLTYIGAWFNGMTIIILDVIAVFTLPKFYETYKVQIDNYVGVARTNVNKVLCQVKSKIPFPKKKEVKKE